ncbi:MAG TPA: TIR domain-containing protein [Burkholderiaceae bacterium]|nr:TIR domain-containing protein [Burkholderiaceae bacterium]
MTQLFISYARENRETAERVAHALGEIGIDVWWDRDIPGGSEFAEVIEQRLSEARVVIVLWSESSTRSGFVRDESMRALEAGKLLPVRIEVVVPPLGFGQIHALDLLDWDGAADDPAFVGVVNEVRQRLGQAPIARPHPPQPRPRWQRRAIIAAVAVLPAIVAAAGGWHFYQLSESRRNLRLGLEEHFGREPNLQAARNYYLDALEYVSDNARARYYLGHVYAQLGEIELARTSFERAVRDRDGLDDAQLADASTRVAALSPTVEPTALVRASSPSTAPKDVIALSPPPPTAAKTVQPGAKSTGSTTLSTTVPSFAGSSGAASVTRLPRIAPSPDLRRRALALVDQMFSDDSQTRITSTTSLVTDPDLLSDAVPLAVEQALDRLGAARGDPSASVQSGVVNTLVLLQSALPGTLVVNRGDIERLLKRAAPIGKYTAAQAEKVQTLLKGAADRRPLAFIQIANEAQRPMAEALVVRLRAAGYDAPGIEMVGERAPASSQVRVQGKSERGFARWIAKVVGDADGEAVAVQTLRNVNPKIDTFEVWFDRDLCTPGRSAPQCAR